jgi:type II secretory pathway pseudopilin PulG
MRIVHSRNLRDAAGFSLVEVLVAATILVAGALIAFSLIDGANKSISLNSARIGGTNLARELIEDARGADYDKLQPSLVVPALQARAGGSGTPWMLQRRGVTYTIETSVCTFDDPKDGLAAAPPENACPAAAPIAGVAANEQNPDDFRRVTLTLRWNARGVSSNAKQSALIVNPAGGLGPRITAFTPDNGEVTSDAITAWSPASLVSTPAAAVTWNVNDGLSQGTATGGPTSWAFSWGLGAPKLNPINADGSWVVDGTYTIAAQAKDSRGVPGEAKVISVRVNRHQPDSVTGLVGGFDARHGGVVDLQWLAYPERDVIGYRVVRDSDGATICGPAAGAEWTKPWCTDPNPPSSGNETYQVYAVDCAPPSVTTCAARPGDAAPLTVTLSATSPPSAPGLVTLTWVDGLPVLDWPDPPPGSDVQFYRIYRDTGTGVSDRYDQTITDATTYTDPAPGTTGHTYWVTAVDSNFNESLPSLPAILPAL